MSDHTTKLVIHRPKADHEAIIAWLSTFDVDAILEEEDHLIAFTSEGDYTKIMDHLHAVMQIPKKAMRLVEEQNQNWNQRWESNFKPISVGNIYVRATFHEPPTDDRLTDLVISPKMAFGTGHHETTYMMLEYLQDMDLAGKSVLDYGCGTGILAVAAKQLGCGEMACIDIQEEAVENTREHFELNGLSLDGIEILQGDLYVIEGKQYEIILANINRHVLLENASRLKKFLKPNGVLVLSGILISDKELIMKTYQAQGLKMISDSERGEWCRISLS